MELSQLVEVDQIAFSGARECRPFIKWAGGKSQLLGELRKRIPVKYGRYFEPFLGGGALFFSLRPRSGFLSDVNEELINAYCMVRDHVDELIESLALHRYEREYYYQVRSLDRGADYKNLSPVERASRLIYLNKSCFNGLYRVNSRGHFNVPFGEYTNPRILDRPNLLLCSEALQNIQIQLRSYLDIEEEVQEGDFVYFDPPYIPLTATASFTNYSKEGFTIEDQTALRDLCERLNARNVKFMLSNSAAPQVVELYRNFKIDWVEATRAINSKGSKRGKIQELIITNYASGR